MKKDPISAVLSVLGDTIILMRRILFDFDTKKRLKKIRF